nr:MAG TPA: hypothetical protein [Caudoviricetes sp.]DAM33648.1 MAG TPA: hypothetical protein [Caudoviricetes sp.]
MRVVNTLTSEAKSKASWRRHTDSLTKRTTTDNVDNNKAEMLNR